jgi:uncharacterized protein YjbI with pentapeptide repeats
MSDVDGTCEYVLDPDDPETWGGEEGDECYVDDEVLNEDGMWSCPHDTETGKDRCIFHLPVAEKDDEKVVDAFLDAIDETTDSESSKTQKRLQFIAAKFGDFDLSENPPKIIGKNIGIDISHTEVDGILDWSGSIFDISHLCLCGIEFTDAVTFKSVEFRGETSFRSAEFREEASFCFVECEGETSFRSAKFSEEASFRFAEFRKEASFRAVKFGGGVEFGAEFGDEADYAFAEFDDEAAFSGAEFGGDTSFADADFGDKSFFEGAEFSDKAFFADVVFGDEAFFDKAKFGGEANFGGAEFGDVAPFHHAEFGDEAFFDNAKFGGEADFGGAEFGGEADFDGAEFGGEADFGGAEFGDKAFFESAEFEQEVNFQDLNIDESRFDNADLTDATFNKTSLREVSFESALLSRATLFGSDLRGAKLSGAVLGDIRIDDDTKFLGHPSDDRDPSPHTFSAIRSRPTCVYDPDYEKDNEHEDEDKAKSVYRALEELGRKHARPRLQARSFVRRQEIQKKDYWDDATADDASLEERFIAGLRWSRARVARATLLYGESPWRVIAWSLGIIFSFALLYPLGGWMKPTDGDPITYAQIASNPVEILNSVYYSTLTYTALGFGDFQPVSFGRLLTTVETGLGAVMLALLVFILGRRAAR